MRVGRALVGEAPLAPRFALVRAGRWARAWVRQQRRRREEARARWLAEGPREASLWPPQARAWAQLGLAGLALGLALLGVLSLALR